MSGLAAIIAKNRLREAYLNEKDVSQPMPLSMLRSINQNINRSPSTLEIEMKFQQDFDERTLLQKHRVRIKPAKVLFPGMTPAVAEELRKDIIKSLIGRMNVEANGERQAVQPVSQLSIFKGIELINNVRQEILKFRDADSRPASRQIIPQISQAWHGATTYFSTVGKGWSVEGSVAKASVVGELRRLEALLNSMIQLMRNRQDDYHANGITMANGEDIYTPQMFSLLFRVRDQIQEMVDSGSVQDSSALANQQNQLLPFQNRLDEEDDEDDDGGDDGDDDEDDDEDDGDEDDDGDEEAEEEGEEEEGEEVEEEGHDGLEEKEEEAEVEEEDGDGGEEAEEEEAVSLRTDLEGKFGDFKKMLTEAQYNQWRVAMLGFDVGQEFGPGMTAAIELTTQDLNHLASIAGNLEKQTKRMAQNATELMTNRKLTPRTLKDGAISYTEAKNRSRLVAYLRMFMPRAAKDQPGASFRISKGMADDLSGDRNLFTKDSPVFNELKRLGGKTKDLKEARWRYDTFLRRAVRSEPFPNLLEVFTADED